MKKFKIDTENDRSKNCGIPKLMENFKIIEWPVIEETPSCSSEEEINKLVLPYRWFDQHLVVTAEKYVHDPGNRGHI